VDELWSTIRFVVQEFVKGCPEVKVVDLISHFPCQTGLTRIAMGRNSFMGLLFVVAGTIEQANVLGWTI